MLAFVHINKTAGTTLNYILARSFGLQHCRIPPIQGKPVISAADFQLIQKLCPRRLVSIAGHTVSALSDLEKICPHIRFLTFLREPVARCVSHYQYDVSEMKRSPTFEKWISNRRGFRRNFQTKKIAGEDGTAQDAIRILKEKFMFVGLFEHFDESAVMFRRLVNDPRLDISYQYKRVASSEKIRTQLMSDSKAMALLMEANRMDFELYEFVTQELYPQFKREYGRSLDSDVADFKNTNELSGRLKPRVNYVLNRCLSIELNLLKRAAISCYK